MSSAFSQAPPQTAAEWFAARRAGNDADLEQRFAKWVAQDARNADEYALCEMTWELSAMAAEGLAPQVQKPRWYRRRGVLGSLALAASLAILAFTFLWLRPAQTLSWQTAAGEQRAIVLPDGSRITLNTRSSLESRMGRSTREIRLLSGEAFFEVVPDTERPFIVETALGKARALGTRFDVLLDGERVEVSTEEGQVLVSTLDGRATNVVASPGQRATIVRGGTGPRLDRADLGRIENWRAQRLEFDRVPLDEALREFSRYSRVPIRPATTEIGQIRVSAVLRTGDLEALRATLKAAFGLSLLPGRNEWLVSPEASR